MNDASEGGRARLKHRERRLSVAVSLARLPVNTPSLTMEQFERVVGIRNPLPIRKWIAQKRIRATVGVPPSGERECMFKREDVVRFVTNRFSPYSLVEATFFRAGVSLMATNGATARFAVDLPKLHRALDELLDTFGANAYEAAIRTVRSRERRLVVRLGSHRSKSERQFLRSALVLMAVTFATDHVVADRPKIHAALDMFIHGFGGPDAYEWAVRDRARQLGASLLSGSRLHAVGEGQP